MSRSGDADALKKLSDTSVMPEADTHAAAAAAVLEHLDHIESGDIAQAISDYAEDAVLEVGEVGEGGNINSGTFRGHEAVGPWLDRWFSSFEHGSYRFTVEESIENGDRVYMTLLSAARGEGSGVD